MKNHISNIPNHETQHVTDTGLEQAIRRFRVSGSERVIRRIFSLVGFAVFILTLGSPKCSAGEPQMTNGQVLQASQISSQLRAICGDDAYAVVQTQWLHWYYEKFRSDLARGPYGIVRWYDTFDCNRFVAKFAADAQVRFFSHSFHTASSAKALAVGEFWYQPTAAPRPHAVIFAYTEQGLVFLDPQTGKLVSLTLREINSHMLAKI